MQKVDLSLQLRATNYDNEDMTAGDWVAFLLSSLRQGAESAGLEVEVLHIKVDFDSINKAG